MRKQGRQQGAHQDHHTAMQCCTEGASQSQLLGESDEWTGGSSWFYNDMEKYNSLKEDILYQNNEWWIIAIYSKNSCGLEILNSGEMIIYGYTLWYYVYTHLKLNIIAEKLPSQKETSLPSIIFRGYVKLGVCIYMCIYVNTYTYIYIYTLIMYTVWYSYVYIVHVCLYAFHWFFPSIG